MSYELKAETRSHLDISHNHEVGLIPMATQTFMRDMSGKVMCLESKLDTAMKLLRDNQSTMHFDRGMSQADHDILREARKWR